MIVIRSVSFLKARSLDAVRAAQDVMGTLDEAYTGFPSNLLQSQWDALEIPQLQGSQSEDEEQAIATWPSNVCSCSSD